MKLIEKLFGIKKKVKTLASLLPFPEDSNTIIKTERGKLFKGHSCVVGYNKDFESKGEIVIDNCYYSGSSNQVYKIDDNITITRFLKQGTTPKWLSKLICEIGDKIGDDHKGKVSNSDNWHLHLEDNPLIRIHTAYYDLQYDSIYNGLKFNSHTDNIYELRELDLLYRRFRNKLKQSSIDDIIKHVSIGNTEFKLNINKNFIV